MKHLFAMALCAALVTSFAQSNAVAQQKTVKACQDEWRANKEANQAAKVTEKAYVEKCRGNTAAAAPAPAPAATPAPTSSKTTTASPAPAPAAPAKQSASKPAASQPAPTAATAPTGANQFAAESQAKSRCPSDTVVWVNTKSNIYHFAGKKEYGTTKSGAYMCEKDAISSNMRAAKNEKRS